MNHDLTEGPKGHVCELPARDGCHDNIVYLAKCKLQKKTIHRAEPQGSRDGGISLIRRARN